FAENPGRLLEKDDLIEKVWHEDFVEEGNLARNVSSLRKALGDTGREHKYIATVQGHGYRFLADVSSESEADEHERDVAGAGVTPIGYDDRSRTSSQAYPADRIRTLLYRRPLLLSICGLCLIGTAIIAFSLQGHKPRQIDQFS